MSTTRRTLSTRLLVSSVVVALSGLVAVQARADDAELLDAAVVVAPPEPERLVYNSTFTGRMVAVSVHPTDPRILVAASDSAGLFQSFDSGASFEHVDALPNRLLDVSYLTPEILLAAATPSLGGEARGGLWRSDDGGRTWSRPPTGQPNCERPTSTEVSWSGPGHVTWTVGSAPGTAQAFAGTDCGLLISNDRGATWTPVAMPAVYSMTVAGNVVHACTAEGYANIVLGAAAPVVTVGPQPIAGAKCDAFGKQAIAVAPDGTILATLGQRLYRMSSAGVWTPIPIPDQLVKARPWLVAVRRLAPTTQDYELYVGGVDLLRAQCPAGVCTPGFTTLTPGHQDQNALIVPTGGPCYLANDGGLFTSATCGAIYTALAGVGLEARQIAELTGHRLAGGTGPLVLYAASQESGILAIDAAGGATVTAQGHSVFALANPPEDTGLPTGDALLTVVARICGNCHNGAFRSRLAGNDVLWPNPPGGATFLPVLLAPTQGLQFGEVADRWKLYRGNPFTSMETVALSGPADLVDAGGLLVRPERRPYLSQAPDPTLLVPVANSDGSLGALTITGLRRTGAVRVARATTPVMNIAPAPLGQGGGGIGATDGAVLRPLIDMDPVDSSHMIAIDRTSGTAMERSAAGEWSVDEGLTALLTAGGRPISSSAHTISFDPAATGRIAVGTEDLGLVLSNDNGATWAVVAGTERLGVISSVFFDRDKIYVATYGNSIWSVSAPTADLSVSVESPPSAMAGERSTFAVTIHNDGPESARPGVTLRFGPTVRYRATNLVSPASCTPGAAEPDGSSTVRCALAGLASGGTTRFSVQAGLDPSAATPEHPNAELTASVADGTVLDPNPDDNTATVAVIVDELADVRAGGICAFDRSALVVDGAAFDCDVRIDNAGPSTARLLVADLWVLSTGEVHVQTVDGVAAPDGLCVGRATRAACVVKLGDALRPSGDVARIRFRLVVKRITDVSVIVRARSVTPDPHDDDNQTAVHISIVGPNDFRISVSNGPAVGIPPE